jgi:hypothetical protein
LDAAQCELDSEVESTTTSDLNSKRRNVGRCTSNAEPLKELAEGVGFEPTVGFPTLDFESSALNRTQPPFLVDK